MKLTGVVSKQKALAAAVIPRHAKIASDWTDILLHPKNHLGEVVRLRKGIDPGTEIDNFSKLSKGTKEALACEDVIWAGELNGKSIETLLFALGIMRFRSVAKLFFVDATTSVVEKDSVEQEENHAVNAESDDDVPPCVVTEEEKRKLSAQNQILTHLQVYNFLKPGDVYALITFVLNRWKVRPESGAKAAVAAALDENWCVSNLKIKGPLLKHLSDGEVVPDQESEFTVFSPLHNRFLLNREHPTVDVTALSLWAIDAGVPLERICSLLKRKGIFDVVSENRPVMPHKVVDRTEDQEAAKRQRMQFLQNAQWMQEARNEGEKVLREDMNTERGQKMLSSQEMASIFEADVKANYPTGFDFKESSVRLIEGRLGASVGPSLIAGWKLEMFERPDGLYFYPDMIMDDATRGRMLTRAGELLSNEGMFALDALRAEFAGTMQNITDASDFKAYFNQFIAEKIGGKVRGHAGWQMCFPESMDDEDGWNAVASRVREMLVGMGDAVSINDLEAQLPILNREIIERTGKDRVADAVSFEIDGVQYLKLLEAYYLPDDFGAALSEFIRTTEDSRSVASIVLIEGMLNERYGENFRTNYGLDDESVFKQVVAKSTGIDGHEWRGDVYVALGVKVSRNIADEFLSVRKGVFHEDEFFAFAHDKRGLDNRAMLICQYLRPRCVRLSRSLWIGKQECVEKCYFNDEIKSDVESFLRNAKGNSPILYLGTIPELTMSSIRVIQVEGRELEWNAYLLTSVAKHFVENLNIVNDEPSPYYVTAMLIDDDVVCGDAVDYVFKVYRESGLCPQSEDEMFDYLKTHQVRMTKTAKLLEKIRTYWGF